MLASLLHQQKSFSRYEQFVFYEVLNQMLCYRQLQAWQLPSRGGRRILLVSIQAVEAIKDRQWWDKRKCWGR